MIKRNQFTSSTISSDDQEYRLLKALSYSALLNELIMERVHGDKSRPGHQTLVNEGLVYLSFHIQDLLQEYIDVDSGVANE